MQNRLLGIAVLGCGYWGINYVRIFAKGIEAVSPAATSYGEELFLARDGDIVSPKIPVSEPLKNQCTHFIDCITQGELPLTSGAAGLEIVQIMEAIDRSIEQRSVPITVES